ncbi:hypothetical protein GCM10023185_46370 [Hymenobacter saemangeumensis]|uniref:DUF3313 domain-containing protein n=1 Tax=Hymenobacter saemangeumensis TaxID=1084522 RepID=A0ABP8ISW9_9BACT
MLKTTLLATCLSLNALLASAQTMPELLAKPEIPLTWMGLDFSATKYLGDPGTVAPEEMKGLFEKINQLMVNEAKKYDLAKAFKRDKVLYTPSITEGVNRKVDATKLITSDISQEGRLSEVKVQELVSQYDYPADASGVGLTFVMEDLNKQMEKAVFWVTFVDMRSRKVLYTEKIAGQAMGFGFRNHWAGGIYDGLNHIRAKKYGEWKKRFAKG